MSQKEIKPNGAMLALQPPIKPIKMSHLFRLAAHLWHSLHALCEEHAVRDPAILKAAQMAV